MSSSSSFERVVTTHCLAALDLGEVLSRQSIVSSSGTVRCSPWGGWWSGHWKKPWSPVCFCFSAPYSRAAEEAITYLYKQERKRPTPVRRRLSRTRCSWKVYFRRVGAGVGDESTESCRVVQPLPIPLVIRPQRRPRMLLSSDDLMSFFVAGTTGRLHLRRRAFALDGQVSAEWSRRAGSMAGRARDSVAPLPRCSAGWMPARIGRLSVGVGRRHPVTVRKASLMAGSMRWV